MGLVSAPAFVASVYNPNIVGLYGATSIAARNLDKHGNLWLYNRAGRVRCIDQTATILQTIDTADLNAEILTFASGGLVNNGTSGVYEAFAVLRDDDESYLVYRTCFYQSGTTIYDVLAVYDTAVDGALTLSGVVWALQNNGILNLSSAPVIGLAGLQTFDDPTLLWVKSRDVGGRAYAKSFPPINDIVGANDPCQSYGYPLADSFIGDPYFNLGSGNFNALGSSANSSEPAFFMPGPAGATNVYIYIGKASMANNHAIYPSTAACEWVETDLYPTYPDGCMVKIPLGVVATPTVGALGYTEVTPTAAADPGVFTNGTPYDAFSDVGTNYDGTGTHGSNDYFPTPSVLRKNDDGTFEVGWYHPFFIDDSYTAEGLWSVQARVRVQTYDPDTEVFTDTFSLRGGLAPIASIGAPQSYTTNSIDIYEYVLFYSGGELFVWNADEASATGSGRYYTWLARVGRAGVSGTTHANIFPRL